MLCRLFHMNASPIQQTLRANKSHAEARRVEEAEARCIIEDPSPRRRQGTKNSYFPLCLCGSNSVTARATAERGGGGKNGGGGGRGAGPRARRARRDRR